MRPKLLLLCGCKIFNVPSWVVAAITSIIYTAWSATSPQMDFSSATDILSPRAASEDDSRLSPPRNSGNEVEFLGKGLQNSSAEVQDSGEPSRERVLHVFSNASAMGIVTIYIQACNECIFG